MGGANWSHQDKNRCDKRLNKSESALAGKGHGSRVYSRNIAWFSPPSMTSPWPRDTAKGGLSGSCDRGAAPLRGAPRPRPPGVRCHGRERPRPGRAPLRGEGRGVLRKQRGQKDKGEKRRGGRGGRAEKGRAAIFFYRFIIPGLGGRKTKNRNRRAVIHVGEEVFLSPDEPRSFGLGFPCQPRWRDETSSPGVEERAPIPRGFGRPARAAPGHRSESEDRWPRLPSSPPGWFYFTGSPGFSRSPLPLRIRRFGPSALRFSAFPPAS